MVAAMNGYMETVKILLDAKANPNLPDSYSQASKFHIIVFYDNHCNHVVALL